MREVTPETAVEYLRETGRVPPRRAVDVRALGWGVSNIVMRVDVEGEPPFVIKQARERLRTKRLWISRLERIWTEKAALELLFELVPDGVVPKVLFADTDNYLFAMTCAPDDSVVWKERLLAGEADPEIARKAGEVLGTIHRETCGHPALTGNLADLAVFDELRIEPFYRSIARAHPDLAPCVDDLIDSVMHPGYRCFVHADFSPKNILVHTGGLTLVDFETAHAGDPAYDLGFFLSHLLLKAVRAAPDEKRYVDLTREFLAAYDRLQSLNNLARRTNAHTAACALARVDGTSLVDYLDEGRQAIVRRFARATLSSVPDHWENLLDNLAREMRSS
jgi:5-methylthioribose kinase